MSIDMKQFHGVFFEETQEHLEEMEHLLLDLDIEHPDIEQLNSIFRAAHSIKGGSGIFGFDALGSLTHIMESLLDKLRQQQLHITRAMVDLFLTSVDLLKDILLAYRNNTEIDWAAIHRISEQLSSVTAAPAMADAEGGEGYGFFSEEEAEATNEAYGFFSDPVVASATEAFGFFDDEPLVVPPVEPSADAIAAEDNDVQANFADTKNQIIAVPTTQKTAAEKTSTNKDAHGNESTSIRVDVSKVDQLINLVGEIVITQSMLNLLGQQLEGNLGEKFQSVASELERNTREIQEAVMSIRMLPVSFVFNRFPRVVRDLSSKLGKSIELVIEGGETELDKGLTEKLVDPLTHLVRNSIDHGIESADVRKRAGKPATGHLTLRAAQQGGNIVISISDDGGGLNRAKILAKAKEKNIPISDNPSDEEVWQLIFAPGFSTADQVTDVSGRGVGLDVVRRNVASLGGRIDIHSVAGAGATFTIHLPLTLAIVDGMCVSVGDQTFIIPLVNIVESMQPAVSDLKTLVGKDQLLWVRDQYWPLVPLYREMQVEPLVTDPAKGIVVLIESSKRRFALFVDGLVGQQQVVIKSLEQHYRRIKGVAGATIMGDGSVALILDVESLADATDKMTDYEGHAA
jgi:two-component system chemotaxis sensor kinase CheA